MSLTTKLNSKSNIKQISRGDLPLVPRQPVIARFAAESSASQTVINLPFLVDTVNAPDSFMLSVDGKLLTPGATNDYQFSGVDGFGMASSVTLNYAIAGGLNIQGIKLGLKKETELQADSRFADNYDLMSEGFQSFVKSSEMMIATTAVGTPAPGTFWSSINGRSSMPDLSKDLRVRFGVDRVNLQQLYYLQNEYGPNGESVLASVLDRRIRFVGNFVFAAPDANGARASINNSNNPLNSFVEITFYGTGVNLLGIPLTNSDMRASVDGGAEGANIFGGLTYNTASITSMGYTQNSVTQVVSGLPLGVHTVKIRVNVNTVDVNISGFEIINDATTLKVNPGTAYIGGKRALTAAQQSPAYNSGFESGTLGTRGGRVLVYQKADGSIAKALTPTNASQANLTSADHSNEEIQRIYQLQDFAVGRSDDWSTTGATLRAFTLNDGSVSLWATNSNITLGLSRYEIGVASGSQIFFTFIGTGIDVDFTVGVGEAGTYTASVDGVSLGAVAYTAPLSGAGLHRTYKIASGLPYGQHTFKLVVSGTPTSFSIGKFTVYQPKTPTLPAGSIELANYNLMANYAINTATTQDALSTGVMYKQASREMSYIGAGWTRTLDASVHGGTRYSTPTNAQSVQYPFYGTGVEYMFWATVNNGPAAISIDGQLLTAANFPGVTVQATTGLTYNNANGQVSGTPNTPGCKVSISGLTLGQHIISIAKVSGTQIELEAFGVITPVHSPRNHTYTEQNELTVGNQSVSDSRKTSAIKELSVGAKAISQAQSYGTITTNVATFVPMPGMSVSINVKATKIRITWSCQVWNSASNGYTPAKAFVNGIAVGNERGAHSASNSLSSVITDCIVVDVTPGMNVVTLCWRMGSGTLSSSAPQSLLVEEL